MGTGGGSGRGMQPPAAAAVPGAPPGRVAAVTRASISATDCRPGGVRPASRAALRVAVADGKSSWNQGCWMTSWTVMRCKGERENDKEM